MQQQHVHRTNNTRLPADMPDFKSALLNLDIGRYIKKWQISARYIGRPLVYSASNTGMLHIHSDELKYSTDFLTENETMKHS